MEKIKKIFKDASPLLVGITLFEIVLAVICIIAFVYSDSLSYADSQVFNALGIEKLLESIYSSTWWALILMVLAFIAILSLTSIVYKNLEYLFISISLWFVMLILAINLKASILDNLSILAIFIPIIILNVLAYNQQKKKIEESQTKKRKKASK